MVTVGKSEKSRVFHPMMIKMGAINSENAVNIKDGVTPIPIGSPNLKFP
jgi:hypothetical protein